jgi:RNA-binding protein
VELTSKQKRWLRGKAHGLDALVQVGKAGLSDGVVARADSVLLEHELIKVRFAADRAERSRQAEDLATATSAALVGSIGRVAILYRRQEDPEKRTYDLP